MYLGWEASNSGALSLTSLGLRWTRPLLWPLRSLLKSLRCLRLSSYFESILLYNQSINRKGMVTNGHGDKADHSTWAANCWRLPSHCLTLDLGLTFCSSQRCP
jgi:hypothetical protein